ncbi:MAG TPA: Flp pilus assembly protein CpaB [Actinomycetota bacterium]|nr:Flp pilus assembly protein CpaB [Actinomycetota bacterium]
MRSRGLVIAVAFVLAMSATFVVYLYVRGVERQSSSNEMMSVVVSDQDIPAGTDLDELIQGGHFDQLQVPKDAVVRGAVTQLSQLDGRQTSAPVLAGEQISTTRLRGSEQLPGGMLGIPEHLQAVTLPLEAPRLAGGAIQQGDHVTIYGTFQNVASSQGSKPAATVTLVPDVEVLKISTPTQPNTADTSSQITLALEQRDAQKVVFAQEQGSVWLALLPPNEKGRSSKPVTALQLVR